MTRIVGYTRDLIAQGDADEDAAALLRAGASIVYSERLNPATKARGELESCLASLTSGDTLIVASVVSLATSVEQLITTVARLQRSNIRLRSLAEPVLSTAPDAPGSPSDVLSALEVVRRRLIGLRTKAGLDAAAGAGRRPGRPRVMTEERIEVAHELRTQNRSFAQIGRALGVSEAAVRRALAPPKRTSIDQTSVE